MSMEATQDGESFANETTIYVKHFTYIKRLTPIQIAAERCNIAIVRFLVEYFKDSEPPPEFDVNFQSEVTGENCALIAVRTANI